MDDYAIERLVGADALLSMQRDRLQGISLCMKNGLWGSALTLIYATIDNLASLARQHEQKQVQRADFIGWTEKYLLPDSGLRCSGLDLWGARCGILHSFSPVSSESRKGGAAELLYAWNEGTEEQLEVMIELHGTEPNKPKPVAVHLNTLHAALLAGILRFVSDMQSDAALRGRVIRNAKHMFSTLSTDDAHNWLSALGRGK